MNRSFAIIFTIGAIWCANTAQATVIFGLADDLTGGRRWDAAPRNVTLAGTEYERSLDGGLRYNVQGGSIAAFRDLFDWQGATPSLASFEQMINDSFDAWLAVDPNLGLAAPFSFVHDPSSPVLSGATGAEIDLFAQPTGQGPGVTGGIAFPNFNTGTVTLTSGTTGYAGQVVTGVDIRLNNESSGGVDTEWTLQLFQTVLTHELGHALGLGDVDISGHRFVDDNYDGTNPATAAVTLTNDFSHLVDVMNPSNSPLMIFDVPDNVLGVEAPGVLILMESSIDAPQIGFLTPDDFGGRQFLYPAIAGNVIPEPATWLLGCLAAVCLIAMGRKRRK